MTVDAYPYPSSWVRAWYARCRGLRAWGGRMTVELVVQHCHRAPRLLWAHDERPQRGEPWSSGQAFVLAERRGKIDVYGGTMRADALSVLLHEMAHVACGPCSGHGREWVAMFAAAVRELVGRRVLRFLDFGYIENRRMTDRATVAIERWFRERGGDEP